MAGNTIRVGVQATGVKQASSELDKLKDSVTKGWSGNQIGKGLVQGFGLAGGLGAARLFSTAISSVENVLGDATKAALEEEDSIQKLGTSLKANIPAWNGNTTAIEGVIKARMALGFSDEEQRKALALTVAATHDVTKALEVQKVAMDLARFKGISLADATDALTKVEAGSYRILKSLGIELAKGATSTEALAAVEKVAAGQAADYANTNSGKLLVSQVKVGEAMEKFGAVTLPIVVGVVTELADDVTGLANAFDFLNGKRHDGLQGEKDSLQSMVDLGNVFGWLNTGYANLADSAKRELDKIAVAEHDTAVAASKLGDGIRSQVPGTTKALDNIALHALGMGDDTVTGSERAIKGLRMFKTAAIADANALIDQAFGPIMAQDKLLADNAENAANRRIIASKSATSAEKRDAYDALHSTSMDAAQQLVVLANAGMTTGTAFKSGLANLKQNIKDSSGPTKAALQGVLDKILAIGEAFRHLPAPFKVPNSLPSTFATSHGRAGGGAVHKGDITWVGEKGPELMQAGGDAFITPADISKRAVTSGGFGGSMGGSVVLNVVVNAARGMSPGDARMVGNEVGPVVVSWLQRNGFLSRTATGLTG